VWDRVSEFTKKFNGGDAVAVRGRVESFQDRLQIVIGRINAATEANTVDTVLRKSCWSPHPLMTQRNVERPR
jgi:DNA/RNA endonuclease YhcR with UshA esterase domain